MSSNNECLLIALEGADRVGKATQSRKLEEALVGLGVKATVEEIPYKDNLTYDEIYRFLKDGSVRRYPQAFQTLHVTNRRHFQTRYLPTLAKHFDVVILDRWNLSTRVYGWADGLDNAMVEHLLAGVVEPRINIVLDSPPWPRKNLDTLEADLKYQQRVRQHYIELCDANPRSNVLVNGSRKREEVHRSILEIVRPLL